MFRLSISIEGVIKFMSFLIKKKIFLKIYSKTIKTTLEKQGKMYSNFYPPKGNHSSYPTLNF